MTWFSCVGLPEKTMRFSPLMDKRNVQHLLKVSTDDQQAFSQLFLAYYEKLVQFAGHIVFQTDIAEDVVADVFCKLWNRRHQILTIDNVEAYLYTAVKNGCFDQRKRKGKPVETKATDLSRDAPGETQELRTILKEAIRALPEQRRLVFWLIKEHGKTSSEVAQILRISPRTVEGHLYKAVKSLADTVSRYLGYDPQHPTGNQKRFNAFFFVL